MTGADIGRLPGLWQAGLIVEAGWIMAETAVEMDEVAAARRLAACYRYDFVDLRDAHPDSELLRTIPLNLMLQYDFLPLEGHDHQLVIAVADPADLARLDELEIKLERKLVVRVAAPSQIRDFLKKTKPSQRVLDEATEEFRPHIIGGEEVAGEGLSLERLVEQRDINPMIRLVDSIIFAGLERRASDIHIESRDDSVLVKYRIDGVLQQAMAPLAREFQSNLISRIKVMSELDIAERRVPQDGRFGIDYRGRAIEEGLTDAQWANSRLRELSAERDAPTAALNAPGPPQLDTETVMAYRRQTMKLMQSGQPAERKRLLRAWVQEIKLEPEKLEVKISYRLPEAVMNSVVAGAGFEPATFGL